MRLLDWFKRLKWIRAIRQYDIISNELIQLRQTIIRQINENTILREENYTLTIDCQEWKQKYGIESEALSTKGRHNNAMTKLCASIDEHLNGSLRKTKYKVVDGQRMSKLTWQEERLLQIELQSLKERFNVQ